MFYLDYKRAFDVTLNFNYKGPFLRALIYEYRGPLLVPLVLILHVFDQITKYFFPNLFFSLIIEKFKAFPKETCELITDNGKKTAA